MFEINSIGIDDEAYPEHLRQIYDPPRRLYYIGDISLIQKPIVGVVGTRRASAYGKWACYQVSKKIASSGIPIVSGMADGIDSVAHRTCLSEGLGTVAVLGTGIDVIYPRCNEKLYMDIAQNGLLLSEYEIGDSGLSWHFPRRNRIISGLSRVVIVVEGAEKSGSMITARLALDQGRDVFAVPGNINQPGSMGVNSLISDGAGVIWDIDNLLSDIGLI